MVGMLLSGMPNVGMLKYLVKDEGIVTVGMLIAGMVTLGMLK